MTVSTTASRISYAGNDVTVAFSFPYLFLANTHIVVVLVNDATGVETTKTITTHYTVTGATNPAGGTVTMVTAPATGETLVLYRSTTLDQQVDYQSNDTFPAETHEGALDKLTLIAQENATANSRALLLSAGDTSTDPTLPAPSANQLLGWNADGDALINYSQTALDTTLLPALVASKVLVVNSGGNAIELTSTINDAVLTGTPTAPTANSGTNTTQIATTAFVTTAVAAISSESYDAVINGNMEVAQERTDINSAATGTSVCDMQAVKFSGSMVFDIDQVSTNLPTFADLGYEHTHAIKYTVTTADASLAAGDFATHDVFIEGNRVKSLLGKDCFLHFNVKAHAAAVFTVAVQSVVSDAVVESFVHEFTTTSTDPEQFAIPITINPATDPDLDEGLGLVIRFAMAVGSTFQTGTTDAWVVGEFYGTSNSTNVCASTNTYQVTGVELTINSSPSTVKPSFADQLLQCQRYFRQSYNYGVFKGTATSTGKIQGSYYANNNTASGAQFSPKMRVAPSVSIYSMDGTISKVTGNAGNLNGTAANIGEYGFTITSIGGGDDFRNFHYVADARYTI